MYKAPENTNHVKTLRTLFENNSSNEDKPILKIRSLHKSKTELEIKLPKKPDMNLSRQMSDPNKKNIKRTPAFRLDKGKALEKSYLISGSSRYLQQKCHLERCDNKECDMINKRNQCLPEMNAITKSQNSFSHVSNKFNCEHTEKNVHRESRTEPEKVNVEKIKNISFLYSEPIPKALRNKNSQANILKEKEIDSEEENFCNKETLRVDKAERIILPVPNTRTETSLTDTLKSALKKPLPPGPAPKKPPRTFIHSPSLDDSILTNAQFKDILNNTLQQNKLSKPKGDPKYMLDKLENALRNNRIRLKKNLHTESITSGEDSDDNVLTKTQRRVLPNIPTNNCKTLPHNYSPSNLQMFNCFDALTCGNPNYERIKEPNSLFFVECKTEEPVYAEPVQIRPSTDDEKLRSSSRSSRNERNSLYYMSSPILASAMEDTTKSDEVHDSCNEGADDKQIVACDTSSLSSAYASDVESQSSTPVDENRKNHTNKIKDIIQSFESKNTKQRNGKQPRKEDAKDRIKELENQLRKTIDKTFSCKMDKKDCCGENSCSCGSANESNSEENKDDITNKFETYVKTVRVYAQPGSRRDKHLFDCCLIVGLNKRTPYIKMKYPEHVEVPAKIEQLCFPDGIDGPMDRSDKAQCYSLVITNEKGKRTFGYCRRIIPEGSENCLPLAYCILSKHRAPRFYKQILKELESRHGMPDKVRDALLSEFYSRQFPRPGECLKIDLSKINEHSENEVSTGNNNKRYSCSQSDSCDKRGVCAGGDLDLNSYVIVNNTGEYGTLKKFATTKTQDDKTTCRGKSAFIDIENSPMKCQLRKSNSSPALDQDIHTVAPSELILALHLDSRCEDTGLKELHTILNINILQKVFASLLLERKVVLVSCVLSKLSSCVEALESILYPFCWPHTLIPILPQSLWEIVEAPTPFICGVLSVAVVNSFKIENAMVVDLDEGDVLVEVGDEEKILPSALVKVWKSALSVAKSVPINDSAYGILLSDAYLRVFIRACGHYKQYVVNGNFQKEAFIQHIKGKGIRNFLTWFTETTMFYSFLDQLQTDASSFAIFDKGIQIYGSDETAIILDKMKDWKKEKTLGSFFRFE